MSYIVTVGGANVDMIGTPYLRLVLHDSAPGALTVTSGGVARNITENLARAGLKCKLLTVFGDDLNGAFLKKGLTDLGVDLQYSLTLKDTATSCYLCLNDAKGEMQYALSAMDILRKMNGAFFEERLFVINQAKYLVADTNLLDGLETLLSKVKVPVILDTVSTQKAFQCKDYIKNLFLVKPNLVEAEALTGLKLSCDKDIIKAADVLLSRGNSNVIITLGEKGLYFTDGTESGFLKSAAKKIVSTTGAGDSFLAGLIYGLYYGLSLRKSAMLGNLFAAETLMSGESVNDGISAKTLFEKVKNI